ncbi:MAG: aminotransferase class I/II-fold pyridoxal phosphate-dependent enzyme [Phycisphaerales bacterium]
MPNTPTQSASATHVTRDGDTYLTFGGCNYLGLAHHPAVISAAQSALSTFGLSTSASRQTTGNAQPHSDLESQLIKFTSAPSARLLPDGYTANLSALQALASLGITHAIIDARAHSSLHDAAKLAQLTTHTYNHLNTAHASSILAAINQPTVILTDSVFTTDGTITPAPQLLELIKNTPHYLLLDDCHGFGVLGNQGRGIADHFNLKQHNLVVTTTLLKGLGCAGGVVLANTQLIESITNTSTAYICTTPASPALSSAAITALDLLQSDPNLHASLRSNIDQTRKILNSLSIQTHQYPTSIFAFTLGTEESMLQIEQELLNQQVILPLMHYPHGPAPTFFRLAVNACHTKADLQHLKKSLNEALTIYTDTLSP